jgi:DNA-binding response OmpR family regulator
MEAEMKVLVVEDELWVALAVQDALTEIGHQVVGPARTAGEALRLVESVKLDLALLDMFLADEVRGTDLAHKLHSDHALPVLFISSNVEEAQKAQFVAVGCLPKPFAAKVLQDSVTFIENLLAGTIPAQHALPDGLMLF